MNMGNKRHQEVGDDFSRKKHKSMTIKSRFSNTSSPSKAHDCPSEIPASHNSPFSIQHQPSNHKAYNGHPSTLPPLPPIRDASLAQVAFIHPGSPDSHLARDVNVSYDRLEFLGDAYIELMASRLIFPLFPHYTVGRLSQLRETLVKNETLSEYALAYGFDRRAKLPANFRGMVTSKMWTKTIGDIFEAYVAAVIMDDPEHGFQIADAWLCALWESKLSTARDTQTVDLDAKTQLAKRVLGKGIKLDYREDGPPQQIRKEGKMVYHIEVYLTGWGWQNQYLGKGSGLSSKDAGAMAAKEALANPLTEKVASVKRSFDEKVRAEREQRELLEQGNTVFTDETLKNKQINKESSGV